MGQDSMPTMPVGKIYAERSKSEWDPVYRDLPILLGLWPSDHRARTATQQMPQRNCEKQIQSRSFGPSWARFDSIWDVGLA